jgi:hypothetical protein
VLQQMMYILGDVNFRFANIWMKYDEYYETNTTYMINNIRMKISHTHIIKFIANISSSASIA